MWYWRCRDFRCSFTFWVQESCSKIPRLSLFNVLLRVGWYIDLSTERLSMLISNWNCFTFWLPFVDFHVKNVHLLVATVGTDVDTDSHLPKNISSLTNQRISILEEKNICWQQPEVDVWKAVAKKNLVQDRGTSDQTFSSKTRQRNRAEDDAWNRRSRKDTGIQRWTWDTGIERDTKDTLNGGPDAGH